MRYSKILLAATCLLGSVAHGMEPMTESDIRNGFREHAAMAQFHRWFQLYERPAGGIAIAMDTTGAVPKLHVENRLGSNRLFTLATLGK